jgi:cell division protein FtsB
MILDFHQKRKIKQFIYSKVTIVLLIIFSLYMVYATYNVYLKKVRSANDLQLADKKLTSLEAKNRELDSQIESLNTPYGIEKEIRSKFFVTKGGEEKMVVIVEDKTEEKVTKDDNKGILKSIRDFFGF